MKPFKEYFILESYPPTSKEDIITYYSQEKYNMFCIAYMHLQEKYGNRVFEEDSKEFGDLRSYMLSKGYNLDKKYYVATGRGGAFLIQDMVRLNWIKAKVERSYNIDKLDYDKEYTYQLVPGVEIDTGDPDLFSDLL